MRKVVISAGHSAKVRGASGELDEYDENVRVVNRVFELLPPSAAVAKFIDTSSSTQNQNLNAIVNFHNSKTRDLDVSIHFNAGGNDGPMGTEVLYVTESTAHGIATATSAAMASVAGWPNRGAKKRTDLFFLNNTEKPAILIEVCFCDSASDAATYNDIFEELCETIAEEIADIAVTPEPGPGPEPEPEVATVEIKTTGKVRIIINGEEIAAPSEPTIPANQTDIIATEFGGPNDPNNSAYSPYGPLLGGFYVALPARFEQTPRPNVIVVNNATGASATASVEDVGPWNTQDPYWETGTRPQAESGTDMTGRQTNGAGIDLSPDLADAIGIVGKGKVDWYFEPLTS
jgi:N-acetylmuramoyl-L-alanine amidase